MPQQQTSGGPGEALEPLSVTQKEAARSLGVSPWTIARMLDDCELEEVRVRGRRLVTYRSLLALLPESA